MAEKMITVGEIVATQGNKGEVRVYPLTDFPDRFTSLKALTWQKGNAAVELILEKARRHKNMVVLKFGGYDDIAAAETLVGGTLNIHRRETVKLPTGHYYFFEIIGLAVFTNSGEYLGKISEVLRTGGNDVYVVRAEAAPGKLAREILLPAIKDVVKTIDPAAGRMTVELPEGLE
ncbi:MAG: ribosome maturation factor RimM [bacterium]|jgi:16S rRNA processing protein RimM